MTQKEQFLQATAEFGQITDESLHSQFLTDFTDVKAGKPLAVFRPKTTEQVAGIMRACTKHGIKAVVQGGLTGLAGGATVQDDEVIINLGQMNQVIEFDEVGGTLCVESGMVLEEVCQLVEAKDWYFPLDLGARGSCRIGGNVSTNAGGNRVLRYGTTRDLVMGIEVVLPDGTVLNMLRRLIKNNTGLDLKHLFIGTEGRYGIITKVMLRLFPKPERRYSALLAMNSFDQITGLLKFARATMAQLSSFEVMWKNYITVAAEVTKNAVPFDGEYEYYVLVEIEGADSPRLEADFQAFLESAIEQELADDAIIPQNISQSQALWILRDASAESMRAREPYLAFDIGIPLKDMSAFIDEVEEAIAKDYPDIECQLFGHLGDGNLHLTTARMREEDFIPVEELVYQITQRYQGSITAEHGIGVIKKPFLHYSRTPEELALMEQIRQQLNPDNTLNNGRVID
ncbi:MAG TPA: FAD-binding oxidoreductase [Oligella sp.]|nr:FAD-binding oxidoreductase [Alcaligenaceae bacterium]HZJ96472.1 FAD-binding oxidoreductase [Oligella sp.]